MSGFNRQLNKGKKGEAVVAKYFSSHGHSVIDVSDNSDYQQKDIDFILENADGQQCALEIKTDSRMAQTGNLFFEQGHQRKSGFRPGWISYCQADYICFLDAKEGTGYVIDWKATKPLLEQQAYKKTFYDGMDDCQSKAFLLPIHTAKRLGLVAHEFQLAN